MKRTRAAFALILAASISVRAETTTDPLWYLLSTSVLSPDAKAVSAEGDSSTNAKGLAALQADLLVLSDGLESFRDEEQVKETLARLEPRMSPELRPFFKDRSSSLDAIYRTLAVVDFTWAQRFPEPICEPVESRAKLLSSRDGLFKTETGKASPWLSSLLGSQAEGVSAEEALDLASSRAKLSGAEYERLRGRARKLTLALASDKAVGAARSKLYCSRAAAFEGLAAHHRAKDAEFIEAGRAVALKPEESVFVVAWRDRRAAATLLRTKKGAVLVTDAAIVADTDHPDLFAYSENSIPIELKATVVRRHPRLSVAVLSYADDFHRPALTLADSVPEKDDLVTAVGHTTVSGLWTRTSGLVTKIGAVSFQTDAAVSPELSGGPVLNDMGKVAGMLVLRPADTEEGRWPVAIPSPILARWIEDSSSTTETDPEPEAVEDAGTAALLSRARPSGLTEAAGHDGWRIPGLPPPPTAPEGVCVQNCEDSVSPGSSYAGGSSNDAQLGQDIGKLGAVLVLKGIPALFRGLGKLFSKKEKSSAQDALVDNRHRAVQAAEAPPPPPPPPKPNCELKPMAVPITAGADPFEVSVQFSCDDNTASLDGNLVTFEFEWDGKKSTQTATAVTRADGLAILVVQVANDETKVEKVRSTAERSHDELDRYDPEKRDLKEPPIQAEKAFIGAIAATGASGAARPFILAGTGSTLRVTATITLGPAATGVLVVITAKQVFDIGWVIGTVVEGEISEVQRGLNQYDKGPERRNNVTIHVQPNGESGKKSRIASSDRVNVTREMANVMLKKVELDTRQILRNRPRSLRDFDKAVRNMSDTIDNYTGGGFVSFKENFGENRSHRLDMEINGNFPHRASNQ